MAEARGIVLIVAGSGETTEVEVNDLLNDAYPEEVEVSLVVPLDKDLFTDTVQNAIAWFNDDEGVTAVKTKGASLSRASSRIGSGSETLSKFSDILDKNEFDGWDEVHFLVALPDDDEDDPKYDFYADLVEVAINNGLQVKNLSRGLDDVTLAEPEDTTPEPEPEPEPEKPARRTRARKSPEPKSEDEANEQVEVDKRKSRVEKHEEKRAETALPSSAVVEAFNVFGEIVRYLEAVDQTNAAVNRADVQYRPLTVAARDAYDALAGEPAQAPAAPEEPAETSSRGRGRPRTNFEVKQILDDDDAWVPRPKGRLRKGTQWRTIHAETGDVLEEGTV